ncbi:MAG: methionyl-tRNA formyltransferase [Bacteroidetes bacterium]|nr:methionyl-tRNA formyltransferase [Bacteroidota bacterium]
MNRMVDPGIIFYGTPDFAVPSLRILVENGYRVKAVVTAPDKPSGRGLHLRPSPVKEFAVNQGIPVLQPISMKDPGFMAELEELKPDLQIVVAFRKLPDPVWQLPVLGTFNLHASLLPEYRGAAPINWALINGEEETGLTTFFIDDKIDTGKVLLTKRIPIYFSDNAGDLHDRMMTEGAQLVLETIKGIIGGNLSPVEQGLIPGPGKPYRSAPKIFKEHCRVSWNKPCREVYNLIRGLSPYPAAFTDIVDSQGGRWSIKIFSGLIREEKTDKAAGTIESDGKTFLGVTTSDGWYFIRHIQLAGKKTLTIDSFLRGFPLSELMRFEG